jgi:hypothetical protein
LFICSDEVAVAGSVVYVLGGYVPEFYGSSKGGNCSEVLPKLSDRAAMGLFISQGGLCKNVRNGPVFFSSLAGTRGSSGARVYEFAHLQLGFVPLDNELRGFI